MSFSFKDAAFVTGIVGAITLNVFLSTALTVALPTIGKDLNFRLGDLQWPTNVYALSYGCLLLFFGRVGDIIGGRIVFLTGSAWFALWSLATAFVPNDKAFIIFMAMMGIGAAANTPSGLGLLSAHFPPGSARNKAYGALGAGQPIGAVFGLILGGILTDSRATWRAIFYFQAGFGAALAVLGWFVIAQGERKRLYRKGLDWGGAFLSTIGLALLTYSLADSATARKGWATPHIPSLLSVSAVMLSLFVYYERRREARNESVLIPLSMWRQPGAKMGSIIVVVFFAWWSFNTLSYFSTLYYQQVRLLNPRQTSLRFVPSALASVCVNILTGYVVNRISGQYIILVGLIGSLAAPVIFALIDVNSSYWAMAFLVMILIVGVDAVYPAGNLHIASAFDEDSQSLAGGVFNIATRIGTSLGLAITSSVATALSEKHDPVHPDTPAALMAGFRVAGWMCFAASSVSFIVALVGLHGMGIIGQQGKGEENSVDQIQAGVRQVVDIVEMGVVHSVLDCSEKALT